MNPRPNEGVIVVNSRRGNVWGREVRIESYDPSQPIDMLVEVDLRGFTIREATTNGLVLFFAHRLNFTDLTGRRFWLAKPALRALRPPLA